MRGMTPRHVRAAAGLILALTILAAGWWWRQAPVRRPNILFITIDTLRADRVGVYGARDLETPAFDRLAGEGVRFEHAYATAPLTLPSHVSMMSGLLPPTHTVRTNDGFHVPDQVPLVAEALRNAGYATGAVVGSFVLRGATGLRRGFASYDDDVGADGERRGHEVEARAGAWLEQPRSTPWFLWVHFFDPHLTYDPPEPQRSPVRRASVRRRSGVYRLASRRAPPASVVPEPAGADGRHRDGRPWRGSRRSRRAEPRRPALRPDDQRAARRTASVGRPRRPRRRRARQPDGDRVDDSQPCRSPGR